MKRYDTYEFLASDKFGLRVKLLDLGYKKRTNKRFLPGGRT